MGIPNFHDGITDSTASLIESRPGRDTSHYETKPEFKLNGAVDEPAFKNQCAAIDSDGLTGR